MRRSPVLAQDGTTSPQGVRLLGSPAPPIALHHLLRTAVLVVQGYMDDLT